MCTCMHGHTVCIIVVLKHPYKFLYIDYGRSGHIHDAYNYESLVGCMVKALMARVSVPLECCSLVPVAPPVPGCALAALRLVERGPLVLGHTLLAKTLILT